MAESAEERYSLRRLEHRLLRRSDNTYRPGGESGLVKNARRSSRGLQRGSRVEQGVCGVTVQLRTPKRRRRRETMEWKRKSAIEEKSVEIYSREKSFSPTSVVIKTNPLFRGTPHRLPANFKGELQLNVHQQAYIAKTKEQEMVNAIIQLAKYGEKKYEGKAKRKSLFQKAKSAISRQQRSKSTERSRSPSKRRRRSAVNSGTPFGSRYSTDWLY